MYKNEDSVGKALKEKGLTRSDLYITTKYAGGDIRGTLETSLKEVRRQLYELNPRPEGSFSLLFLLAWTGLRGSLLDSLSQTYQGWKLCCRLGDNGKS